jgi:hypothetical protein
MYSIVFLLRGTYPLHIHRIQADKDEKSQKHKAKKIYTLDNQKHEQRIRSRKIAPYEITSIYNPPEEGP